MDSGIVAAVVGGAAVLGAAAIGAWATAKSSRDKKRSADGLGILQENSVEVDRGARVGGDVVGGNKTTTTVTGPGREEFTVPEPKIKRQDHPPAGPIIEG